MRISMARLTAALGATVVAAAMVTFIDVPGAIASPAGSETLSPTGGAQSFTVPASVTAVTADVFGARGGSAVGGSDGGQTTAAGGGGGRATGTVAVNPGDVLDIRVGGPGLDGAAPATAGAGGFNGGGDGSIDGDGTFPGGGGGGGATDIRTGSCAATNACAPSDRVLVGGGGGGAGGGASTSAAGGAGGGTDGGAGTDTSTSGSSGGGGTQSQPGAAGADSSAGTIGDTPSLGDGGPGGGGGGGGGGGLHGGGGGGADSDGAGGGGGSGFASGTLPVAHQQSGVNSGAASASVFWMTLAPDAPVAGDTVNLTSHLPASTAGGTETFTDSNGPICSHVLVGSDGTAQCTTGALGEGSRSFTATYTSGQVIPQATGASAVLATPQFDQTFESVRISVAAPTTTSTTTTSTTTSVAVQPSSELARTGPRGDTSAMSRFGVVLLLAGASALVAAAEVRRRTWRHVRRGPAWRHLRRDW